MSKYRVAILGCGPRGAIHARAVRENSERFDLVALCDMREERLVKLADEVKVSARYTAAEKMMEEQKPDLYCFATLPHLRLPLFELGVRHGAKAIAFEKPISTTLKEARAMLDLSRDAGVLAVVSHQQKYGPHWQAVKRIVENGEIGRIHTIHATSRPWLLQLGTHLLDYSMWFNGNRPAVWAIGQVHGKTKLDDSHPSPDYLMGQAMFDNGVRCILECGSLAPDTPEAERFWLKDAVNLYGTEGWARVVVGGGWKAMTKSSEGKIVSGGGVFEPAKDQPKYIAEIADWMDDPQRGHSCDFELAFQGFETAMAMCLSAIERRKVDLPIEPTPEEPILERLRYVVPDVPYEGEM